MVDLMILLHYDVKRKQELEDENVGEEVLSNFFKFKSGRAVESFYRANYACCCLPFNTKGMAPSEWQQIPQAPQQPTVTAQTSYEAPYENPSLDEEGWFVFYWAVLSYPEEAT